MTNYCTEDDAKTKVKTNMSSADITTIIEEQSAYIEEMWGAQRTDRKIVRELCSLYVAQEVLNRDPSAEAMGSRRVAHLGRQAVYSGRIRRLEALLRPKLIEKTG